jgi:RNA polymerase sigma factor (sigma-70 family)
MEELDLVDRVKAGQQKAFEILVDRFQGRVYNACLGFLFNREDAEDLTQEVFLEVHRSIHTFEGRAALGTWIHRIAMTKSLELIRSRGRKKRAGQLLSLFGLQQAGWDPRADALDHPGIRLENQERARHLYAAIGSLPEQQRVAFTLAKIEGRSYEEVAEIMALSIPSIESLLFRAKKGLQKKLEHFYREDM